MRHFARALRDMSDLAAEREKVRPPAEGLTRGFDPGIWPKIRFDHRARVARLCFSPSASPAAQLSRTGGAVQVIATLKQQVRPPPLPSRTKWTRRVHHPVLIGHAASLTPY